jgi:DedD protein
MGLFSRKDRADAQTGKPRPSVSSEAHAGALRVRARRRLAGAVALVLAAVIVLPMVLDSEPVPLTDNIPIQIPEQDTDFKPVLSAPQTVESTPPIVAKESVQPPPLAATTALPSKVGAVDSPGVGEPNSPTPTPKLTVKPEQKLEAQEEAPSGIKQADAARSDDGALALALLEGRQSPAATSKSRPARGHFVLQVASYAAQAEAQGRRDQLHEAGVTNAFVEPAAIGGKQQYRLRVGPFPSREAAQAAQARLRTLGYDNGFIASQ